jgi:hypothetical protein
MTTICLLLFLCASALSAQVLTRSSISSGSSAWSTSQQRVRVMVGTRLARITTQPTSVNDEQSGTAQQRIDCAPIPASESLHVQFNAPSLQPFTLTFISADGRQHGSFSGMTSPLPRTDIVTSVAVLPNGTYLLVMSCGGSRVTATIIIQR